MITLLAVLGGWLVLSPAAAVIVGLVLREAERCERTELALDRLVPAQRAPRVLVLPDGS